MKRLTAGLPMEQTEEEFQSQIIHLAKLYGWRTAHFRASLNRRGKWQTAVQGDGKGFPDLVLVRDRVIWVELKKEDGATTPDQEAWISALLASGQIVYIWRPSMLKEIMEILQ